MLKVKDTTSSTGYSEAVVRKSVFGSENEAFEIVQVGKVEYPPIPSYPKLKADFTNLYGLCLALIRSHLAGYGLFRLIDQTAEDLTGSLIGRVLNANRNHLNKSFAHWVRTGESLPVHGYFGGELIHGPLEIGQTTLGYTGDGHPDSEVRTGRVIRWCRTVVDNHIHCGPAGRPVDGDFSRGRGERGSGKLRISLPVRNPANGLIVGYKSRVAPEVSFNQSLHGDQVKLFAGEPVFADKPVEEVNTESNIASLVNELPVDLRAVWVAMNEEGNGWKSPRLNGRRSRSPLSSKGRADRANFEIVLARLLKDRSAS